MEGQLIQYVNDNDPNSEVDYFPYTTFNAVFEDESKTLNLKQYIEEKILKSEQGGALGVEANTISGGAVGNKASADSGGAVGANAKTVTGGAVGANAISEKGGAVGENAVTLLQLSETFILSGATLSFDKEVIKGSNIPIKIESNEIIPSTAVNINITNAYTMTKNRAGDEYSPNDYFNIEMGTIVAYNNINAVLYARKDFTPISSDYEHSEIVANATPIYIDIEYQIENNGKGGTGFAGGFNSKATSGGAIGEKAETISGGAAGQGAESTWGGAIGQNASTQAGGAIGLRSYSEAGGAIGVDSKTTWGGAIGFLAESNWGFAGGEGSLTKDGGSIGVGAKSNLGGAVGRSAKTENGGAIGQNASSLSGFAGGYKAEGRQGAAIGSEAKLLYNENATETDRHGKGAAIGRQAVSYHGGSAGWETRSNNGFAGGCTSATEDGGAVGYAAFARNGFAGGYGAVVGNRVRDENNNNEIIISNGGSGAAIGYKAQVGIAGKYEASSGGAVGQEAVAGNGFAGGYKAKATGDRAIAIGSITSTGSLEAKGTNAIAIGAGAFAEGEYSIVIGSDLSNDHVYSNAAGKYAIAIGTAAQVGAESAVQLGKGTNTTKESLQFLDARISNGVSTQSSGSDMAEYFEWEDGNINKQDRRGYFVSLSNSKIRLANSNDDYILGVISSEYIASFVGNTAAVNWKNKYLKDIYGDFILDENGEKIINPEFNDKIEYLPRFKRAEWAVVCLIGQIVINDDGTCIPGGYCKVNDNGEGTIANIEDNIKYKVLERLDNNHVRILFK